MAFKPGHTKKGGRKKGTPNNATALGRDMITKVLSDYFNSGLLDSDFAALEPKDRLTIAEKLMQYTLPKMQATSIDIANTKTKTIEDTLIALSQED